ncbi:MAG: ROK family protein [Synergistaceae bacterium]|jgi:glucokinase|nr:ROK family protein [Synergistaceae bacterium]
MKAIGVDLGGHKIAAGRVDGESIETRLEERTESSREPGAVIAQIARVAHELGAGRDVPVGICVPGGLDAQRERAMMITNFAGWNGLPIRQMFEDAIGAPVVVENDANAYALGEGLAGAAKGVSDYVVLTLGTGLGGGVVIGGRLLTGAHGMAGELGHMVLGQNEPCGPGCGGLGHFEALCGADALERRAKGMGLGASPVLKDLWLKRDSPEVAPLWELALNDAARGVATLIHVFDPQMVVIGGGLHKGAGFMELLTARVPRYLGEPFRRVLNVRGSELDTDAPIFGGAARALTHL